MAGEAEYSDRHSHFQSGLPMRLSDAILRWRQTKLLYRDHRPTPWLSEDTTQTIARTVRYQSRLVQYFRLFLLEFLLCNDSTVEQLLDLDEFLVF
jgi:hypothetical protein